MRKTIALTCAFVLGLALGFGSHEGGRAYAAQAYQALSGSSVTTTGAITGASVSVSGVVEGGRANSGTDGVINAGIPTSGFWEAFYSGNALRLFTYWEAATTTAQIGTSVAGGKIGLYPDTGGTQRLAVSSAGAQVTGNLTVNAGSVSYVVCSSGVAVSAPADTTEAVLYTCAIPAGAMGPNGTVRLAALITFSNTVGTKDFRIRFSGISGTSYFNVPGFTNGQGGGLSVWAEITNRNSATSQVGRAWGLNANAGTHGGVISTSAVDTTTAQTIVVTGKKGTAGDTITLERAVVEVLYGP
jgi:hypothetical protein